MTTNPLNLIPGKNYQVFNTKFKAEFDYPGAMIASDSTHEFIKTFPCYDARYHGVGTPDDYIVYVFKLPKQFGEVTFYRFQITKIVEA